MRDPADIQPPPPPDDDPFAPDDAGGTSGFDAVDSGDDVGGNVVGGNDGNGGGDNGGYAGGYGGDDGGRRPPPAAGDHRGNPWERRAELGIVDGLVGAVKGFIVDPAGTFLQSLRSGDYMSPILFAIVVGWVGIIVGEMWGALFSASLASFVPGMQDELAASMLSSGIGMVVIIVLAPVFIVIGMFLAAGLVHLALMLVGGDQQSASGFEGTFRAVCYGYVAALAKVIPIVGGLVGSLWWMVLVVIGLIKLHDTTEGKAIAAVLIVAALCCLCCIGLATSVGAIIAAAIAANQ